MGEDHHIWPQLGLARMLPYDEFRRWFVSKFPVINQDGDTNVLLVRTNFAQGNIDT